MIFIGFGIVLIPISELHYMYTEAKEPLVYETPEEVAQEQPVQVVVKVNWTADRIEKEIDKVFPDAPIMKTVAWCESRLNPKAFNPTNGSNDRGIFQISEKYHGVGDEMFDVEKNLAYARKLYDQNGLSDWSASKHCWR